MEVLCLRTLKSCLLFPCSDPVPISRVLVFNNISWTSGLHQLRAAGVAASVDLVDVAPFPHPVPVSSTVKRE